ncbi:MAG: dolichyl-phosphate beta-glucosyltransferase [Phycisphaerae bacterium]
MQPGPALSSLSVIIPAYNAAPFIAATLADVHDWLARRVGAFELIVVDDGSVDETAAAVRRFGRDVQLMQTVPNRGKGHAVRTGMLASACDWALFMDADNSTRIAELDAIAPRLADADVWIASRRMQNSRIVRRQQPVRQALGRAFPYFVRRLVLPGISDSQCGFKLFSRAAVRAIFPHQQLERFAFDVELLALARRAGLRIAEFPIDWDNPTDSSLRIGRDAARMLADLFGLWWRMYGGGRGPGGGGGAAGRGE